MELTKEQRHECYKYGLKRFNQGGAFAICLELDESLISIFDIELNFSTLPESFPELLAHKPSNKDMGELWWQLDKTGREKRIEVLESCIEQTKP